MRNILAWLAAGMLWQAAATCAPTTAPAAAPTFAQGPATLEYYRATLSGPGETPPNDSDAFGFLDITVDRRRFSIDLRLLLEDLSSPATAAHLHCCAPQALGGTALPATMLPSLPHFSGQEGWYTMVLDLNNAATYNPAFIAANGGTVTSARDALLAGMAASRAYFNVHSYHYPGGEMRGFIVPQPVPASTPWLLLGVGVALLCAALRWAPAPGRRSASPARRHAPPPGAP